MTRYLRVYLDRNLPFPGVTSSLPSFDAQDGYLIDRISDFDVRVTSAKGTITFPWARVIAAWDFVETKTEVLPPPPEPEPVVEMVTKRWRAK